jgi:hypothetical protein
MPVSSQKQLQTLFAPNISNLTTEALNLNISNLTTEASASEGAALNPSPRGNSPKPYCSAPEAARTMHLTTKGSAPEAVAGTDEHRKQHQCYCRW